MIRILNIKAAFMPMAFLVGNNDAQTEAKIAEHKVPVFEKNGHKYGLLANGILSRVVEDGVKFASESEKESLLERYGIT